LASRSAMGAWSFFFFFLSDTAHKLRLLPFDVQRGRPQQRTAGSHFGCYSGCFGKNKWANARSLGKRSGPLFSYGTRSIAGPLGGGWGSRTSHCSIRCGSGLLAIVGVKKKPWKIGSKGTTFSCKIGRFTPQFHPINRSGKSPIGLVKVRWREGPPRKSQEKKAHQLPA